MKTHRADAQTHAHRDTDTHTHTYTESGAFQMMSNYTYLAKKTTIFYFSPGYLQKRLIIF